MPRNEYGNVELFLPSMLPPGGVHIRSESTETELTFLST